MKHIVLTIIFEILFLSLSFAQEETIKVEVLSKSTTSWDGTTLQNYPEGQPEITISRITIPIGFKLPPHTHQTPLAGYVVSGELTVIKNDSTSHTVKAGETIVELINTVHYGSNEGSEPVVLLAFYMGIEGIPLSINQ
tara:strand:- start:16924 stop:17337 length:414 start_codon:yes stop_codon:yes gene_type:complete